MNLAPINVLKALGGLSDSIEALPEKIRESARIALNDVLKSGKGRGEYIKAMKGDINFPEGYIDEDRFGVTQFATNDKLEVVLTARQRPVSLARFATGAKTPGQSGVTVGVKRGRSSFLEKSWIVRLRQGNLLTEDNFNLGLAVRIKPGQVIRRKRDTTSMVRLSGNVFLLYGPSIDQVFRTTADKATPQVIDFILKEYNRQAARIL